MLGRRATYPAEQQAVPWLHPVQLLFRRWNPRPPAPPAPHTHTNTHYSARIHSPGTGQWLAMGLRLLPPIRQQQLVTLGDLTPVAGRAAGRLMPEPRR